MAAYNKPGVYIEETLTPSTPIVSDVAQTNAVFIGVTDRGPTATTTAGVVGVPTLVTSWTDYYTKFGFGSSVDMFSTAVSTSTADMRYGMYAFFKNGGNAAYVLRNVNTNATAASSSVLSQAYNTVTATVYATTVSNAIAVSVGNPTTALLNSVATNGIVTLQSLVGTSAASINKSWFVQSVSATGFVLTATGVATTLGACGTNVSFLASSTTAASTTNSLILTAKDHGTWASKVWYAVQPSPQSGFFDLSVYYSATATNSAAINDNNRVERFPTLNLNPNSSRYINKIVNSSWINVSVTGTNTASLPMFTYYRNDSFVSASPDGSLIAGALPLGVVGSATNIVWTADAASDGTTVATAGAVTSRLDDLNGPLVINQPNTIDATTINNLLSYAANRGDAFVVIDSISNEVTTAISTAATYSTVNGSYGAVYAPQLVISDPASSSNQTRNVPAGAAVVAEYLTTDANRGVFKAPAGTGAVFAPSTFINTSYSLTNTDFDTVSNAATPVNIIRRIPGVGFCVMGARTLSPGYDDRYVPVRRTLGYLRKNLTDITAFAVFEPNNSTLWNQVSSTVESFLYSFWRQGGLYGATPGQAYYVKCDATTNNAAAQAAGELRLEVGVALQRPAEFVVIKLGQYQGGTTVTTSV